MHRADYNLLAGLVVALLVVAPASALSPRNPRMASALSPRSPRIARRELLSSCALLSSCGAAAVPLRSSAKCTDCVNTELETSPLIEELKRRTEANAAKNAAAVKESVAFAGPQSEPALKMVRYAGAGDSMPVTRMMTTEDISKLEQMGFKVSCPSWGGACSVEELKAVPPPAPPAQ